MVEAPVYIRFTEVPNVGAPEREPAVVATVALLPRVKVKPFLFN